MILTVTPNPALDLAGVVDEILPDEKNYVQDETRHPGGNGINAAQVIAYLGVQVSATGFLGGGTGQEIRSLLDAESVLHHFIPIDGHTRTSVTVSNRKTHRQTRLSFQGPDISKAEARKLEILVSRLKPPAILVIGGSLPGKYLPANILSLAKQARSRSVSVFVDVPGKLLAAMLRAGPHLIKPNLSEFCDLVQKKLETKEEVLGEARSRSFLKRVPILCVSSVQGGAVFVTPQGAWFGKGPRVRAMSSVGAGDSMVGAMTAQIWKEKLISKTGLDLNVLEAKAETVFRWGLAAAMATVITPGTQLGTRNQIEDFLHRIEITRINVAGKSRQRRGRRGSR